MPQPRQGQGQRWATVDGGVVTFPVKVNVHMILRPPAPGHRLRVHRRLEDGGRARRVWTIHAERRDLLEAGDMHQGSGRACLIRSAAEGHVEQEGLRKHGRIVPDVDHPGRGQIGGLVGPGRKPGRRRLRVLRPQTHAKGAGVPPPAPPLP
jgi:hypothetical protein